MGRGRGQGERWRRRIGDCVDKAADVIREIQGPSISDENERGQLNIGLTKNTTTLVRHSRSCHSFPARIIRYIKIIYLSPVIYLAPRTLRTDRFLFLSFSLFFPSSASFGEECLATQSHVRRTLLAGRIYVMSGENSLARNRPLRGCISQEDSRIFITRSSQEY